MTDKLSIYNGALSILGERRLTDLTENREPRYKLDDVWDNNFVKRVLQMGQWQFAQRTVKLDSSPSVTPSFGYQYGFDGPTDWLRTMGVCYDEYFQLPITRYSREGAWWFCDTDPIYVKYVSDDSQFGGDFSLWTHNFTEMAEHYMAYKVGPRLIGLDADETNLMRKWKHWLAEAKAVDAMEDPAKFPPRGGWSRSRQGFRSSDDRGSRNQLIG